MDHIHSFIHKHFIWVRTMVDLESLSGHEVIVQSGWDISLLQSLTHPHTHPHSQAFSHKANSTVSILLGGGKKLEETGGNPRVHEETVISKSNQTCVLMTSFYLKAFISTPETLLLNLG